jgi:ectoine hydroxylase-related dioxygenase (phytanoyl-CoA dioxygenase family)
MTADQLSEYHEKGYVALRNLFSPEETDALKAECDRLWAKYGDHASEENLRVQMRAHTNGRKVLDRFDPVSDLSAQMKSILTDRRILGAVSQVFQDEPLPFKDKLIFKTPGTHGYDVHQDYTFWLELPAPPEALLTVLVPVDVADADNGATEFYPGMHHQHLRPNETPHDVFDPNQGLTPKVLLEGRTPEVVRIVPGDILIFNSLVPHQSGVNRSGRSRRLMFISYVAGSYGDLRGIHYNHLHRYLSSDRGKDGMQVKFW